MTAEITLSEYRRLAVNLPYIDPIGSCCGERLQDPTYVEPLEGRNTLEVDRTCIVKCKDCGKLYVSRWD